MKNAKKNATLFKLFWYKVFVHWKLKLLNFLMNFVSICLPAIKRGSPQCDVFMQQFWTLGSWQFTIWQVWTWTITSYPVHLGEEITINMLAGKLFYFSCLFWKKVQNVNFSVSSFREEWNKRLLPILWKEKFQTENYYLKRQAFYI